MICLVLIKFCSVYLYCCYFHFYYLYLFLFLLVSIWWMGPRPNTQFKAQFCPNFNPMDRPIWGQFFLVILKAQLQAGRQSPAKEHSMAHLQPQGFFSFTRTWPRKHWSWLRHASCMSRRKTSSGINGPISYSCALSASTPSFQACLSHLHSSSLQLGSPATSHAELPCTLRLWLRLHLPSCPGPRTPTTTFSCVQRSVAEFPHCLQLLQQLPWPVSSHLSNPSLLSLAASSICWQLLHQLVLASHWSMPLPGLTDGFFLGYKRPCWRGEKGVGLHEKEREKAESFCFFSHFRNSKGKGGRKNRKKNLSRGDRLAVDPSRKREREIGEFGFCLVKKGFGLAKGKDERVSFVIGVKEMSMGYHLVANPTSFFFACQLWMWLLLCSSCYINEKRSCLFLIRKAFIFTQKYVHHDSSLLCRWDMCMIYLHVGMHGFYDNVSFSFLFRVACGLTVS